MESMNIRTPFCRLAAFITMTAALCTAAPAQAHYGSGDWGGPGSGAIQDAAWTDPDLRVGIIGDSITYRCAAALRAAFSSVGVTVAVRARSGQNTSNANDWLAGLTYLPGYTVMLTGTNDVFAPPAMAGQIARTKALTAGSTLVWGDTWVARAGQPAAVKLNDVRNSGWVNAQIHAALPANHVIDWNANIGHTVARGGDDLVEYYVPDGVHPEAVKGCANYTEIVMQTMRPLLGLAGKRAAR